MAVEDEGAVRGVDAHRHGAVLEQRQLERLCVAGRHIGVTLDACDQLRLVQVAESVLSRDPDSRRWGDKMCFLG